jgi:hypothetical protein
MFRCECCGTGFNPTVASVSETCPRCRAAGIDAKLRFRLFEPDRRAAEARPRRDGAEAEPGRAR